MEHLFQDIKFGARLLLRNPGFTAVAVLSLALGIGANSAIFSVVRTLLDNPFPVARPEELVSVFTTDRRNPGNLPTSHLNFKDIRAQNSAFAETAAFAFAQLNYLAEGGSSEQVAAQVVTGNYFDVLGVRPAAGRTFHPDEDRADGSGPVTVISYGMWERLFGRDPSIVGRTLSLNRQPFTVVGVAPRGFTGTLVFGAPDLWIPMSMHSVAQPGFDWYEQRRGLFLFAFARLKPGQTVAQAQANLRALGTQLERDFPNDNQGRSFSALPLTDVRINPQGGGGPVVQTTLLLMAIVGVVLLIACANIANLLLARGTARAREIAVRLALGARRARLIRQLLTESVLLATIGGALSLAVAHWCVSLIRSAPLPVPQNFLEQLGIDSGIMIFTAGLSVLTGVLFGLAPALRASKPELVPVLKNETVPVTGGSHRLLRWITLRQALVVGQVGLSLIALVTAGLFLRSLQAAQRIDPGFETSRVLTLGLNLGREGYSQEQGLQFHDRLLERAAALPGATSVAVAQNLPFQGGFLRSVLLEGSQQSEQNRVLVQVNAVSPGYLRTVGIPLVRGRDFTSDDKDGAPLVVIVNETMAERFFPKQDPIGRRFRFFGDASDSTVIAIARDAKYNNLTEEPTPFVYLPLRQAYNPAVSLLVRASGDGTQLASAARALVREIDPRLTVLDVGTLRTQVDLALAGPRVTVIMLSIFGLLALVLASMGLYGVASYSVSQRTREIGIRMALGATRTTVMRLVLLQALALVGVGIVLGLLVSALLSRSVQGLLVGVPAADPLTYFLTAAVLIVVAAAATFFPARRATNIDPLVALRYQ
jgi:predicted permease